jgi:hypothetical protein
MSQQQYYWARKSIIGLMHDILDRNTEVIVGSDSSDDDSDDDDVEPTGNANYSPAADEFVAFEKLKKKKYLPILKKTDQGGLSGDFNGKPMDICVGAVLQRGKDISQGKNLADYIDSNGIMDLLKFFKERKKVFPTLWILVQKKASTRVVEVGCERFFALSGYVSAPRRTRLGVHCYERLAMLSMIVNSLYIDPDFIAAEVPMKVPSEKVEEIQ